MAAELARVDPTLVLAIGLVIGFVLGYAARAAISWRRRRPARGCDGGVREEVAAVKQEAEEDWTK
jgi:hypothetical protein